jgi:hypothetical protein
VNRPPSELEEKIKQADNEQNGHNAFPDAHRFFAEELNPKCSTIACTTGQERPFPISDEPQKINAREQYGHRKPVFGVGLKKGENPTEKIIDLF